MARGELAIRSWELKGQEQGSSSLVLRVSSGKKERDRGGGKGRGLFLSLILNNILKDFIITPQFIKKKKNTSSSKRSRVMGGGGVKLVIPQAIIGP